MPSPFAQQVYDAVKLIPEGKVTTYKTIAEYIGKPNASQAIGQVLKRNPYAPFKIIRINGDNKLVQTYLPKSEIVPCHRVVAADGKVGGYFGIMDNNKKIELLEKEGVTVCNGTIDLDVYMFHY